MHERRNFALVLLLAASVAWVVAVWLLLDPARTPMLIGQRAGSLLLALSTAGWLVHALRFEDRLPNHLKGVVGDVYFEADGISFMPTVRLRDGHAELCVYYQNRFENPACAIIHLRPVDGGVFILEGWNDVHFAFKVGGGDFGVIHQPITVPDHLRGEVINMRLAAASHYPRAHGTRLRSEAGVPCGTMLVDWNGAAFKTGVHEVSGEIELRNPAMLHLCMPRNATPCGRERVTWVQERLEVS